MSGGPFLWFGAALAWAGLLSIPVLIVLLYFLKLKRKPVSVPSTFLWSRTIEDLHVNTIWQRLRRNLLMFLQLMFVMAVILACLPWAAILDGLGINWRIQKPLSERVILLVDASASMNATDLGDARLDIAKQRAEEVIDRMDSSNVCMIISFSDGALVEQSYTGDTGLLRRKLDRVRPTQRTSNLTEALQAAAGLANPGRTSEADSLYDVQVADPLPATLYMFTDGGVSAVPDFNLGNLEHEYVPIGDDQSPDNVGIVMFAAQENPERPGAYQAFARLENCGTQNAELAVSLFVNNELWDAKENVTVPAAGGVSLNFDLTGLFARGFESAAIRLELDRDDDLAVDNRAYAVLNRPRPGRILLMTHRNEALDLALRTSALATRYFVDSETPSFLADDAYAERAATGYYDLIIYDRCAPEEMPNCNSLFFGEAPLFEGWNRGDPEFPVAVIDTARSHPLMQLLELRPVIIVEAGPLTAPPGSISLIDSNIGSIAAIAPREGYEDVAFGFSILTVDEEGNYDQNTDWPRHLSFPVFVHNMVEYLVGGAGFEIARNVQPGDQVRLRPESPVDALQVTSPSGRRTIVRRDARNDFVFHATDDCGIYEVRDEGADDIGQRFAVNLFDRRESDLRISSFQIGDVDIEPTTDWQTSLPKIWKWLLVAGLIILLAEWYIYNKRVFL